jgi:hypothetical protein
MYLVCIRTPLTAKPAKLYVVHTELRRNMRVMMRMMFIVSKKRATIMNPVKGVHCSI